MNSTKQPQALTQLHAVERSADSFPILISAEVLKRCRARLEALRKEVANEDKWPDFLLGVCTTLAGAFLGDLEAGGSPGGPFGWLFFYVFPAGAVGTGVAFWYSRRGASHHRSAEIAAVMEALPEPIIEKGSLAEASGFGLAGTWNMHSITSHSKKAANATLSVSVRQGQLSISGQMTGETPELNASITSRLCDFDAHKRTLLVAYRVFGHNKEGVIYDRECVLSGVLTREGDATQKIEGTWFAISGDHDTGHVTLTKRD